jgi:antitoxin component of MazEF toxin-antitoxin module
MASKKYKKLDYEPRSMYRIRRIGQPQPGYSIYGITLSKQVLKDAGMKPGDHVEVRVPEEGFIVLAAVKVKKVGGE